MVAVLLEKYILHVNIIHMYTCVHNIFLNFAHNNIFFKIRVYKLKTEGKIQLHFKIKAINIILYLSLI